MRTFLLVLAVTASVTSTAEAQHYEPAIPYDDELGTRWPGGHAFGELSLFSDDGFTAVGFHGNVWARIGDSFALEGTFGLVHANGDRSDTSVTNPAFSAMYVNESRNTLVRVGAGLAPPAVNNDAVGGGLVWLVARGIQDVWLVDAAHLALLPTFRIDGKGSGFLWGGDAVLSLFIPTEDGAETEVFTQGGFDIAGVIHPAFHLGGRLQMGWLASDTDTDADVFQMSLVPFVRFLFGAGFFEGRFVVNLDEPAGFSFDSDGLWMVELRGGGRF